MRIVGRNKEKAELQRYYSSGQPEFVAVYGRRRVGKTFLIKEYFNNEFNFYFTGTVGSKRVTQLSDFDEAIRRYGGVVTEASKNWSEGFRKLRKLLEDTKHDGRNVVFIDELPWLDTRNSDFLPALDYFWNSWASSRPELLLIVCGSATSWIVKRMFQNRGGLHNRLTGRIHLAPFTLRECEEYFAQLGVVMNRPQIIDCYSVFGGIPYYLRMFNRGLGPSQNVDNLLFSDDAPLKGEYGELYRSLFANPQRHLRIVEALAGTRRGMTRDEIRLATDIPEGGHFTQTLAELEQCDFIRRYGDFTKPKNGAYYRLIDPFTLFWLRFGYGASSKDEFFWTNLRDHGSRNAWSGYAFEDICLQHLAQIKQKLGIAGVLSNVAAWRSKESKPGAQIDLVIDRADGVINLCEMKCTNHLYTISKEDGVSLQNKLSAFANETGTGKALHLTMITSYGLSIKGYRGSIQAEVSADDLFA
ncbi:MAG: AAA family ATPase [Coriobacteriales bacterium]|jgi:AAA+ ATPase superfamily predicted ATPase|nr:AAA family ATPase [Coriobacteriales bacterium]